MPLRKLSALLLIFTFIGTIFLGIGKASLAQNELDDYQYQYEKYTSQYQDFLKTRDEYVQYQTLSSKEELVTSFRLLLVQRAETQRTYFLLLRQQLRNNPGLIVSEKNKLITYF